MTSAYSEASLRTGLIDENGRISLNPEDYAGMDGDSVKRLFGSLDYEVYAVFDENGGLVQVYSEFDEKHLKTIPELVGEFSYERNLETFHNHPMSRDTSVAIFSPTDIASYAEDATLRFSSDYNKDKNSAFSAFSVWSSDGNRFEIRLSRQPGPYQKSYEQLSADYLSEWNRYMQFGEGDEHPALRVVEGTMSYREASRMVSAHMSNWIKKRKHLYGLEYSTTL